eukprot:584537-Rhodomonas_salina.1
MQSSSTPYRTPLPPPRACSAPPFLPHRTPRHTNHTPHRSSPPLGITRAGRWGSGAADSAWCARTWSRRSATWSSGAARPGSTPRCVSAGHRSSAGSTRGQQASRAAGAGRRGPRAVRNGTWRHGGRMHARKKTPGSSIAAQYRTLRSHGAARASRVPWMSDRCSSSQSNPAPPATALSTQTAGNRSPGAN